VRKKGCCTSYSGRSARSCGTNEEWERCEPAATQDLYNTSWSFKNIMHSMISKVQYAKRKPLNQWTTRGRAKASGTDTTTQSDSDNAGYEDFMFNPAHYTREDIASLKAVCEQPRAATIGTKLREATKIEWSIIAGIAIGSMVCRRPPEFLRSVMGSKERIRF
jgi:hypothetical protein